MKKKYSRKRKKRQTEKLDDCAEEKLVENVRGDEDLA